MNEFISPHQNININISYNLGNQEKIPKVVFGKKIDKIVKSTAKEQPKQSFKMFKRNEESNEQAQQIKKTKSTKKAKPKKKSNALLTLPDQQQPLPRRLKTQGNTKTEIGGFLIKKQFKSTSKPLSKTNTQHFKSLNNTPLYCPTKPTTKKSTTQKKEQRRNSNKSCILYQQKKHLLLSDVEHVMSTTTNGPTPVNKQVVKKRANSANVIKSQKFIHKLLDLSVLTSELGGSIPMVEDKAKSSQNTNNRIKTALQEFMSSIDMRIIKKMEQDNHNKKAILVDFKVGEGLELITFLNKIRRIPLEKLNEKAIKIQRFWRKKQTQSIIPYYSNMFFRNPAINSKAAIDHHLSQISGIQARENNEDELLVTDNIVNGMRKKQQQAEFLSLISGPHVLDSSNSQFEQSSISAAKIKKMMDNRPSAAKSSNFSSLISEKQEEQQVEEFDFSKMGKISEKEDSQVDIELSASNKSNSLNIEKYRQLVKKQIEQQQNPVHKFTKANPKLQQNPQLSLNKQPKPQKQQNSEQGSTQAHWNHVHNILSTNMNKKVPLMSKTVLEELMKQSAFNKQWVEGQFSNSQSRKISSKSSPRPQVGKQDLRTISQKNQAIDDRNQMQANEYYFQENSQEEEEEEEQNLSNSQYNWNKYSDISKLKKPQQITVPKQKQPQPQPYPQQNPKQQIPGLLPTGIKNSLIESQIEQYQRLNGNKVRPKSREINIEPLELEDQCNQEVEKNQKWMREQMIMEDGIVEKYLDCGLDCFGLKLNNQNAGLKDGRCQEITIEQQQEKDVQQKEEHKATLEKDHHPNKATKLEKVEKNQGEHKDDDIFSNETHNHQDINDDDMELVYVFQNTDGKLAREAIHQHIDVDHASKNSKRNDNANHLGNRQDNLPQLPANLNRQEVVSPHSLLQPSFSRPPEHEPEPYTLQQLSIQQELNTKRKEKITEQLITKLIQEFAYDVSLILRRSQNQNGQMRMPQNQNSQRRPQNDPNSVIPVVGSKANANIPIQGIQTSFQSLRDFITKIKTYILADEAACKKIIDNLKNNIGPSSIQILSYLRIEDQNQFAPDAQPEPEEEDNEEWLFVIPNQLFQVFNKRLLDEQEAVRGKKLSNRFKLYTQFWHRSIFQCYNQCLDYQRPYGITGAPYKWICEAKLPRSLPYSRSKVEQILQSAQNRLLQLSCSSSGIIFDKPESPYRQFELSEQHKVQLNEQKISRMLANEIIDDEYNWITYNDQITELLVDISRKVEELLIFQVSTDIKKIMRRRRMMVHVGRRTGNQQSSSEDDQHAVFLVEDLV